MTALSLFTYAGQQVRTVIVDGEPWFVAGDVTDLLGYANGRDAIARIPDRMKSSVALTDGTPGNPNRAILNEAGVNRLIMRSTLPEAERVQDWISEDVLPSIRKTGSYSSAPALTEDQIVHQALTILVAKTTALEAQVAELAPSAAAWDDLASAEGDYEVADAAKILARAGVETGRQRLFNQLHDLGWIYRGPQGKWRARQTAVDNGYLAEKPMSHHHPRTGELVLDPPQVRVTVRGLERLRVRLGSLELMPTG